MHKEIDNARPLEGAPLRSEESTVISVGSESIFQRTTEPSESEPDVLKLACWKRGMPWRERVARTWQCGLDLVAVGHCARAEIVLSTLTARGAEMDRMSKLEETLIWLLVRACRRARGAEPPNRAKLLLENIEIAGPPDLSTELRSLVASESHSSPEGVAAAVAAWVRKNNNNLGCSNGL